MNDDGPEAFHLLFVCTGNTCRSPLAAALARREVAERGWAWVEVRSAGVGAGLGGPASDGARRAAERHGLDLSEHESTPLDETLVAWADLVLVMSASHALGVMERGGEEKVALLSGFAEGADEPGWPVPDPFGGGDDVYEETYRVLQRLVADALDRLEPIVAP